MAKKIQNRLGFNSFERRSLLIFTTFVILVIALASLLLVSVRGVFLENQRLAKWHFIKYEINEINSSINESFAHLSLSAYYPNGAVHRQTAFDIFNKKATPALDTLQRFVYREQMDFMTEIDALKSDMDMFINSYERIENQEYKDAVLGDYIALVIVPQVARLADRTQSMSESIRLKEVRLEKDLEKNINERIFIFAPLFLFIIIVFFIFIIQNNRFLHQDLEHVFDYLRALRKGDIPQRLDYKVDELHRIIREINALRRTFQSLEEFSFLLKEDKQLVHSQIFAENSRLGVAFDQMQESLKFSRQQIEARRWQNEGVRELAQIIRQETRGQEQLCKDFISYLVSYIGCEQGALFVYDERKKVLQLEAAYAYQRYKFIDKTLEPGEGFVGEIFLDAQPRFITDVPKHYSQIISGTGGEKPAHLLFVPIKTQYKVVGVVELGSFKPFPEPTLGLIERASEILAADLADIATQERMQTLLQEAKERGQELQNNEQQLSQTAKELTQMRNALKEQMKHLEQQLEIFQNLFKYSNFGILITDPTGEIKDANKKALQILQTTKSDARKLRVSHFIPTMRGLNTLANQSTLQSYKLSDNQKVIKALVSRVQTQHNYQYTVLIVDNV
ncbi:MAG: GAF domain-containing protein [Bernardetiaceae bacterium]|nr:GAF domain-containing protein [Bernardetiaceae bacterium]